MSAHGSAFTTRRQTGQPGSDDDTFVGLHVPQRERPLKNVDTEAVRPLAASTRIGSHDVEPLDIDVTAHHRIAYPESAPARSRDSGQPHPTQTLDSRVVENHAFVGRRRETQPADFVGGGELQTVDAIGERNRGALAVTEESLTRSKADGSAFSIRHLR